MSWVDLFLLAGLVTFAIYGLQQGFVSQLASLGGLGAGFLLAVALYHDVASLIIGWNDPGVFWEGIAFAAIVFVVWLLASVAGTTVRNRLRARRDWTEDVGGAMLGLISGVFVLALFVAVFGSLDVPLAQTVRASRSAGYLLGMARGMASWLSRWVDLSWL